ncbi:uncharacterized protein K460DRAFT_300978 [Cucurbitaria berberidis CBS 394.84]|uniref:Uncharacterized protein n=1 Tax=Cucurbitaria berberidis CBS 394.84 TaxID=1168544 RepID=A0A9P4GRI3_9PLEO|nr:uncharacterized protein K460DRAFT_300978 [Cucurbitaria berberidis CBS 394.84]KAF1850199.1 hypothetical protein K460DRAFT_300978 [Cucurbitaria berberidis CBS 394.84]
MAGPLLNLTIFKKSTFHALRAISLVAFPPAFIILLIQGIISGDVNPAIGILPLFFSSAFSALLLANEKKCGCQASGLTGTPIHLVFDVCLGVGLLVCLILDWVFMDDSHGESGMVMLGTYGTNFLICNFLIHLYFVARQLSDALTPGSSYPMSCPQCQNGSFSVGNITLGPGPRSDYTPLLDEGEQSRNSAEGEQVNGSASIV